MTQKTQCQSPPSTSQTTEEIRPQKGFQERFLSTKADIAIGGGSAGGGKTFALLLESLRHVGNSGYGGVIFRRTTPQIMNVGGLWDCSMELYTLLRAEPKSTTLEWRFPSGAGLKFSHIEYEKDVKNYQGAQITFIGFDELTHFTERQFFYLLTRNRSMCGIRPYVRASCNPDPDSWVAALIEWWIDQETGFPIPERDGVLRYFIKDGENYIWGNSKDEVVKLAPHILKNPKFKNINVHTLIKSVTFIRGDVYGNKLLLERDPAYLANLLSQDAATKAQLLDGNWKIRQDGLSLCNYEAINDLFTNFIKPPIVDDEEEEEEDNTWFDQEDTEPEEEEDDDEQEEFEHMYLTCDAARFGVNLAVLQVWRGFQIVKIVIFTTSSIPDQVNGIEELRKEFGIMKSHCIVDEDGVGGGVVDGGYVGFHGDQPVKPDEITKIKENYANLKTQCAYRMADRINKGKIAISLKDVVVDGVATDQVQVGKTIYDVSKLIKEDLRSQKRDKPNMEGKKRMIPKSKQKVILKGRSPDNGDAINMREYFEIFKPETPGLFVG